MVAHEIENVDVLARVFLATITNTRSPWAGELIAWAAERGLTVPQYKAIKVAILRELATAATTRAARRA